MRCALRRGHGRRPHPGAGGVHGWEAGETRELAQACGARLRLGETAVRWDGRVLLAIGQDGPQHLTAAALVIATGARPLGRAELGIAGGRPAGVVAQPSPATWPRTACWWGGAR